MHNGASEKIRLNGIDCPESGQAFGNKAKQFASDMVFGKTVTIKGQGKDKYGRTIGDVFLPDGTCLNKELVKEGLAWWYRQYSNDKELEQLEREARSSNKGLWFDSNPTAPWDFRHNPDLSANSEQNLSSTNKPPSNDTIVYVTKTGSKYHSAFCRYLKSAIPIKLLEASSRYSPCSACNPPVLGNNASSLPNTPISSPALKSANDSLTETNLIQNLLETVYVTKTGSKYHRAGCHYLKSCIPISLKEAAQRYSPCSVCNPPTLNSSTINNTVPKSNPSPAITGNPAVAENGDIQGADNDGDGRSEPVYVGGYYRKDGTYVRGHYRAKPRRK